MIDPEPRPPLPLLRRLAREALAEDLGSGDLTTGLTVAPRLRARGRIVAREGGVVAGVEIAAAVFRERDPELEVEIEAGDSRAVEAGAPVVSVTGYLRSILEAERVALNFLQRTSGIATLTRRFVEAVEGTGARIVDTRKTTPGLRALEKYAVRCGGGRNHRFGLADGFLLKENHRAAIRAGGATMAERIRAARNALPHTVLLEVEVDDLEELGEALEAGAEAVLLDNFTVEELRAAVERAGEGVLLEASGGITLETVREVAGTGVDLISVGALTHSAPALDLSLEVEVEGIGTEGKSVGPGSGEDPPEPRARVATD